MDAQRLDNANDIRHIAGSSGRRSRDVIAGFTNFLIVEDIDYGGIMLAIRLY